MNWKRPWAEEVEAPAVGLKSDSILAVVRRYSKLVPLELAACLIAPATRTRAGSTPGVAVAFDVSTDIPGLRSPRNDPTFCSREGSHQRSSWTHSAVIMVKSG